MQPHTFSYPNDREDMTSAMDRDDDDDSPRHRGQGANLRRRFNNINTALNVPRDLRTRGGKKADWETTNRVKKQIHFLFFVHVRSPRVG